MPEAILAIDQGTTGTTVMLLDRDLNVLARGYREIMPIFPHPGWVEHDPEDIWKSVLSALKIALKQGRVSRFDIKAIGVTNQRETIAVWNRKTGNPFHNAIVWQCRRTAGICEELKEMGHEDLFVKKTGLVLDPYFSGTKLKWLFDNLSGLHKEAAAGRVAAGTIDTFLAWKLTDGRAHVTDVSNASRTLLMDLKTLDWDERLCRILGVPLSILPEIRDSAGVFGHTRDVPGLPDGVPICGMAGDQQAALFGQACFEPGEAKCTYGTGAFLLMNPGPAPLFSNNRLLPTVAWKLGRQT
ncbi:MAG: glycerol kinase, partial [Deltaproteobacteria bacterium]|nr:glycerol kinase [Deltaproteobacteria bacterium]